MIYLSCGNAVKDRTAIIANFNSIDKINAPFKTVYIPGHAGISAYNEAADHLAGKAHPTGNIVFHPSDVSNRLNGKMAHCWKPTQTSWPLNRPIEHGVKFGDGAKEKTRRAAIKINTQKQIK